MLGQPACAAPHCRGDAQAGACNRGGHWREVGGALVTSAEPRPALAQGWRARSDQPCHGWQSMMS
eukprot:360688-Chlamydomonas_euryale.AAC.2